jgi:hypothetical protein
MNASALNPIKRPCAAWASSLAAGPEDLTVVERAALDAHVATCAACAAARSDYARMDTLIRGLPAPAPLASLPAELTALWQKDTQASAHETADAEVSAATTHALPVPPQRRLPSRAAAFGAIAAVMIVGVVIAGFAALLGHRQSGPGATTGLNYDFGPTVLPTGPQPQVANWRQIVRPTGAITNPDTFRIVSQTSVPGLLYACAARAEGGAAEPKVELREMWRSEDGGRTWTFLDTPFAFPNDLGACQLGVSPGAPNTVFLPGSGIDDAHFSLDRGDHWQPLDMPSELLSDGIEAPEAVGDTWYFVKNPLGEQPRLWVSRDHGAHWARHAFPVLLPPSGCDCHPAIVGTWLRLRYEKGGLLFLLQHTLWWTPDYGETWQNLGKWSQPPCVDIVIGSPDLSTLYCPYSYSDNPPRAYWRSLDQGATWRPVPPAPQATPGAQRQNNLSVSASPVMLRDGSLLEVALIPGDPQQVAFYSLAPGANVWRQASDPLNEVLGLCSPSTSSSQQTQCGLPNVTLADGPNGTQTLYTTRLPDGETVAATITWK